MQLATEHNVKGIIAECGGNCACGTCHCVISPPWSTRVPEPDGKENDLLDCVPTRETNSRLSCQILLSAALDGMVVKVPSIDT